MQSSIIGKGSTGSAAYLKAFGFFGSLQLWGCGVSGSGKDSFKQPSKGSFKNEHAGF